MSEKNLKRIPGRINSKTIDRSLKNKSEIIPEGPMLLFLEIPSYWTNLWSRIHNRWIREEFQKKFLEYIISEKIIEGISGAKSNGILMKEEISEISEETEVITGGTLEGISWEELWSDLSTMSRKNLERFSEIYFRWISEGTFEIELEWFQQKQLTL